MPAAGALRFEAGRSFPIGANVTALFPGDFDGDGRLDLLMTGESPSVLLVRGNGDGTLGMASETRVGSKTMSDSEFLFILGVADLTGDGHLDALVAPSLDATRWTLLRGRGDGTFDLFPVTDALTGAVVSDLDGDGRPEVVTAGNRPYVRIFQFAADGSFRTTDRTIGGLVSQVAAGDFNRDGRPDLVLTQDIPVNEQTPGSDSRALFLPGQGTLSFGSPTVIATGLSMTPVAVGDVNEDGSPDLGLLTDCYHDSSNASALLLLGDGAGNFHPTPQAPRTGCGPLWEADMNDDGHVDIVTPYRLSFGRGDGTFVPEIAGTADGAWARAVADFDGDGLIDLVEAFPRRLAVTLAVAKRGIVRARRYVARSGVSAAVAADVDADGHVDLIGLDLNASILTVLRGRADGTFATYIEEAIPRQLGAMVTGDWNGDGHLDIVTAMTGPWDDSPNLFRVLTLLGDGKGDFRPQYAIETRSGAMAISALDFDGDGRLDLAIGSNRAADNSLAVLRGGGDGGFTPLATLSLERVPTSITTGDFDGDGRLDFALGLDGYVDGGVGLVFGGPGDTLRIGERYGMGGRLTSVIAADLDRDGDLDLVVTGGGKSRLVILLNDGTGRFASGDEHNERDGFGPVAAGDLDGDGILDLAVAAPYGDIAILRGRGDGTFEPATTWNAGSGLDGFLNVVIADFNGDGRPDVARLGTPYGVLLNRSR